MIAQLDLIRDFVNTRDLLDAEEHLATREELAGWWVEHGLLSEPVAVSASDLRRAQELREALRLLLLANNEVEVDQTGPSAVLEAVARRARLELRFDDGRATLEPVADGPAGALGRIVAAVESAMSDGSWPRLKACRARDCEWAFEDNAKNRSRAWCSMRSCGNREKARAYRLRHSH
jgi:predicted RNA-binding Zn ribbon-like protein